MILPETELRNMVNDVDQNDNGMIEFNEFLQMMSKKMREGDSEDELKEAFKWVYDIIMYERHQHEFLSLNFMLSCLFLSSQHFHIATPKLWWWWWWCAYIHKRTRLKIVSGIWEMWTEIRNKLSTSKLHA